MKRFIIILLGGIILSAAMSAQQKVYCEMMSDYFNTKQKKIRVDFGTRPLNNLWSGTEIVDAEGNAIMFNSPVQALNYMASAGWSLDSVYQDISNGDGYTRWILSKILKDGEDIEDGVMTRVKYDELIENRQTLIGGSEDEHGCLTAAGYTWSEARQNCIRVWEEGTRLKPYDRKGKKTKDGTSDIFLVFSPDSLKAELFFPDGNTVLLDRRKLSNGDFVWNMEDDDTPNVRKDDNGKWLVEKRGLLQYNEQ